jgi:hypothetical protein
LDLYRGGPVATGGLARLRVGNAAVYHRLAATWPSVTVNPRDSFGGSEP